MYIYLQNIHRIRTPVLLSLFFSTLEPWRVRVCICAAVAGKATKQRMGRRRVQIKRIENKARRQTTFTKRRDGLFKKTGEMCTLCDAEAAIITFSEGGNAFTYGNPTVNSVVDSYLTKILTDNADEKVGLQDGKQMTEIQVLPRLQCEKKQRENMDKQLTIGRERPFFDAPIETVYAYERDSEPLAISKKRPLLVKETQSTKKKKKKGEASATGKERPLFMKNIQPFSLLESEKKQREALAIGKTWLLLDAPIESLALEELEQLKYTVEEMIQQAASKIQTNEMSTKTDEF